MVRSVRLLGKSYPHSLEKRNHVTAPSGVRSPRPALVKGRPGLIVLALLFFAAGCSEGPESYQGYVEGEYLYLASSQSGRLEVLAVASGDVLEKGGLAFKLEGQPEATRVRQAEGELAAARDALADLKRSLRPTEIEALKAQVAEARAALSNSAINLKRSEALFKSRSLPQSRLDADRSQAEADAARVRQLESQLATALLPTGREEQIKAQAAKVEALAAALDQARWHLGEKTVTAPRQGKVHDIFYRPGEWVQAGGPVLKFLPPENLKIRFFVPEKDFGRLRLGQRLVLEYDSASEAVPARITYLAPEAEYTPPVIYSNETRSKLVFMAEARPESPGPALNPGQPLTVRLVTEGGQL